MQISVVGARAKICSFHVIRRCSLVTDNSLTSIVGLSIVGYSLILSIFHDAEITLIAAGALLALALTVLPTWRIQCLSHTCLFLLL